jgi:putative membrane protein
MWYCGEGSGWWAAGGAIFMVLFWGSIIALLAWGIRNIAGRRDSGSGTTEGPNPLKIAQERYARGEISKTDFDQISNDLSHS